MTGTPITQRLRDECSEIATEAADVIDRLYAAMGEAESLLADKTYIQNLADYNRGHLSHAGSINSREAKFRAAVAEARGEPVAEAQKNGAAKVPAEKRLV